MATLDYDKIVNGIRKALYGYEVREYLAQSMEWTKAFVTQSVAQIKEYLRQAEAARDAAKASQDAAKVSETNAANSATASANSAAESKVSAASSANFATASANSAAESKSSAESSASSAAASKASAADSANAAMKALKEAADSGAFKGDKGDKGDSGTTNWDEIEGKPSTFPPSAHNHSKLAFENTNEVNFVGTPENNTVYWGYRNNTIDEYRFNDGRGSGAFANVRANKFIGSLDGNANTASSATKASGVTDYKDSSRTIQVGYAGDGLNTSNLTHIAGYTDNGTKIKDVSKAVLQSWLGLDSAASGVQSSGSNYIRFGDGTQICWGTIESTSVQVTGTVTFELYLQTQYETATLTRSGYFATFPQPFANTSYSVALQNSYDVTYKDTFKGGSFTFYSSKFDMNITGASLASISETVPSVGKATTNCSFNGGSGSMYVAVGRWK